jgi:protein-disulfide isomerase
MQKSPFTLPITILAVGLLIAGGFYLIERVRRVDAALALVTAKLEQVNTAGTATKAAVAAPIALADVPVISDADPQRGPASAKVTLVEYSDFECPFCKRFHPTLQEVKQKYGDNVRWVYRHLPLSFHEYAQNQAEVAACVMQVSGSDAFWKFSDALIERTEGGGTGFAPEKLLPLAAEAGADQAAVGQCVTDGKGKEKVAADSQGAAKLGLSGTPSTLILRSDGSVGTIIGAQPQEQVNKLIEAALAL